MWFSIKFTSFICDDLEQESRQNKIVHENERM
jgi:hypothetical protein